VDQSSEYIAGFTDSEDSVVREELPVVVFGDHTRILKYVDFPFAAGADGTKILKPNREIFDSSFFFYALLSLDIPNKGYNRHYKYLRELSFQFPVAKAEQRAIALSLETVQRAKQAHQRELTLERERKAALMEWLFTHGTRGGATKQAEIGEIPRNWELVTLGDVARISSGGTPDRNRPEYWNGGIPWVKTGEIRYNTIRETEETISTAGLENSAAKVIPAGTLLMAMYGQGITRGKVAILGIDATLNQACAAILLSEQVMPNFAFFYLQFAYERIRTLGHGANQKNLNAQLVGSIRFPLPPLEEQETICYQLAALDAKLSSMEKECALLEELLRAMLEELVTGRLSAVPLIEEHQTQ
jgi:type I restriction enzyme S subunit